MNSESRLCEEGCLDARLEKETRISLGEDDDGMSTTCIRIVDGFTTTREIGLRCRGIQDT